MKNSKEVLESLYNHIKNTPAWLSYCLTNDQLSNGDIITLVSFADGDLQLERIKSECFYLNAAEHRKKVEELKNECNEDFSENWTFERKSEYLNGLKESKLKRYKKTLAIYRDMEEKNISPRIRVRFKRQSRIDEIESDLSRIQKALNNHLNSKYAKNERLTDDQIVRAGQYPIEKLIDVKKNYAKCPFHDDHHRHLYTKNNFYYCFVCGESGDSIKLAMELNGIGFIDAVKLLT